MHQAGPRIGDEPVGSTQALVLPSQALHSKRPRPPNPNPRAPSPRAGSLLGCAPLTVCLESAAGIREGGRTGVTALSTALCFFVALFFTPLIVSIPSYATGPALIIVGALMMEVRGQKRPLSYCLRYTDATHAAFARVF